MQYHWSPQPIVYVHDLPNLNTKESVYAEDLRDASLVKLPAKIKEFNDRIAPDEIKLDQIKTKITTLRSGDTGLKKFGRVLSRIGLWAVAIVGSFTIIPIVAVTIAATTSKKIQRAVHKFAELLVTLTPKEELDARDEVYQLQKKYGGSKGPPAFNPLDTPVQLYFRSNSAEPNFSKTFTLEKVKTIYDEMLQSQGKPPVAGAPLVDKEQLNQRIRNFNQNLHMFDKGGIFGE